MNEDLTLSVHLTTNKPPLINNYRLKEKLMAAYWIARARIDDPAQYKKYTDIAPKIIESYGGKTLARGGDFKIMEGPEMFKRFIVIEFPSLEQAEKCFNSAEYQSAASHRRNGGGIVENVIVEGVN
jgi:uncharacterized protein (DUF1330 family)